MEDIKDLLVEEIKTEIIGLSSLAPGSDEKSAAIDDLAKLYRLKIEETKNELEFEEKCKRRFMEDNHADEDTRLKEAQFADQVIERYFRVGIAAAEIVLPLLFYAVWMRRGLKFEENGTYTSTTFRGLFNRFKPTKR